ncbi:MAG: hypothetical protein ABSH42_18115 [Bryobacteraceae bacterium]|jgi:hypothetical protein
MTRLYHGILGERLRNSELGIAANLAKAVTAEAVTGYVFTILRLAEKNGNT